MQLPAKMEKRIEKQVVDASGKEMDVEVEVKIVQPLKRLFLFAGKRASGVVDHPLLNIPVVGRCPRFMTTMTTLRPHRDIHIHRMILLLHHTLRHTTTPHAITIPSCLSLSQSSLWHIPHFITQYPNPSWSNGKCYAGTVHPEGGYSRQRTPNLTWAQNV